MERVIEFNDDSGAEGEHIAQTHAAGSEAEFNFEADIHEAAVAGEGQGRRRRRWLNGCLPGGRRLNFRMELGGEGGADLNFDGAKGAILVASLEANDRVGRPGGSGGGGEIELNLADSGGGKGGSSEAGDLAQIDLDRI